MAIALISSTKKAAAGASPGIDTTGANLLVAILVASGTPTLSDSNTNAWTNLAELTGSLGELIRVKYVADPVVGAGHTFTIGGTFPSGCFAAFSGALAATPHEAEDTGVGVSVLSPGSATPAEDNELVLFTLGDFATGISISEGSIIQNNDGVGGVNFSSTLAYTIQTTATSVNPAWTFSGGFNGGAATNFFKAAAAAAGHPASKRMGGVKFASHGGYQHGTGRMQWRHEQSDLWLPNNRSIIQPENRMAV